MKSFSKFIALFDRDERRHLIGITLALIVVALFEVMGVGSIAPFIAVASDPSIIETNNMLSAAYGLLGFQSHSQFLLALGIGVILVIVIGNAFAMVTVYYSTRYVGMRRYVLGLRLFRQYLYQPYSYYLNHNTSELSKNLLNEVNLAIDGFMLPGTNVLARGMVALGIIVFLVILNPLMAVLAAGTIGFCYAIVFAFVRVRLTRLGRLVQDGNRSLYKSTSEAFGAIKDIKILGKEPAFESRYAAASEQVAASAAVSQIMSALPRYVLEAVAFGLVVLLVLTLVAANREFTRILPLLSVYAMAAYRVMPALQAVFQNLSIVRTYSYSIDSLFRDLVENRVSVPVDSTQPKGAVRDEQANVRLPFTENIRIDTLSFRYPNARGLALAGIDLLIRKNTTVGLVGSTGCGKTTLVDVILGLLHPSDGRILVDGEDIAEDSMGKWQRNFGYVPQQIFLADDTVFANIAFGIPDHEIDFAAVERAALTANLHRFVVDELPEKYNTLVGEKGIRLSGGQRQRIGIARALYHDPEILVLDEATSALDSVTEEAVMDAIRNLMHSKTIIIIAHRITTVQPCDVIHVMERGRIVASGTYDSLLATEKRFRAMAKVRHATH